MTPAEREEAPDLAEVDKWLDALRRTEPSEYAEIQKWLTGFLDLQNEGCPTEVLERHLIIWNIADDMAEAVKHGAPIV